MRATAPIGSTFSVWVSVGGGAFAEYEMFRCDTGFRVAVRGDLVVYRLKDGAWSAMWRDCIGWPSRARVVECDFRPFGGPRVIMAPA